MAATRANAQHRTRHQLLLADRLDLLLRVLRCQRRPGVMLERLRILRVALVALVEVLGGARRRSSVVLRRHEQEVFCFDVLEGVKYAHEAL